jgi:hypothetical protein
MCLYGVVFGIVGRIRSTEDGPPPTKREILEQKLARLEAKEAKKNEFDSFS